MPSTQLLAGTKSVTIVGSAREIEAADGALCDLELTGDEPRDRLLIQAAIDVHGLKAAIFYDGSTVWGMRQLLADLGKVLRANDTTRMSKQLYQFLSLQCGSSSRINLQGWAAAYPDNDSLRGFFRCNERGVRVSSYVAPAKADVLRIVKEMEGIIGA